MPSLGRNAKAYRSATLLTGDITGDETWIELDAIRNVTVDEGSTMADNTFRDSNGFELSVQALKQAPVSFEIRVEVDDADYQAIRDAYQDGTQIAMLFATGDIESPPQEAVAGNYSVESFGRDEANDNIIVRSVTVQPSSYMQHVEYEES